MGYSKYCVYRGRLLAVYISKVWNTYGCSNEGWNETMDEMMRSLLCWKKRWEWQSYFPCQGQIVWSLSKVSYSNNMVSRTIQCTFYIYISTRHTHTSMVFKVNLGILQVEKERNERAWTAYPRLLYTIVVITLRKRILCEIGVKKRT